MAASRPDIEAIFSAARLTDPADRAAFLDEVCGDDALLRGRIERFLDAQSELGSFLESSAGAERVAIDLPPAVAEHPGTMIGPYKLLEPIGEGGMGTVWMAQQSEPIKRRVAIKLIKPGMDSEQVLARFDAERQALALMDHPNIAKVFDAGSISVGSRQSAVGSEERQTGLPTANCLLPTADGRPYFVMELVKGIPITKYCDEHHLTPRQRLELFIPVCHAIQHAHQKGIIHRDIKPSNVLVAMYDDRPVPKVIDFGLAKATGQQLTEATLHTNFGAVVGTLEYMSPEQASFNQLDVDTRSDIYSLGVLLYELLAGSPPFSKKDLEKAGVLEMLRVIREQEPSKPSTKLSSSDALPSLSANRGTEPSRLTKLVRGELDWIVMKTLEKDRSRRYETANGFALDLQRYLADEQVLACPPSMGYRLRKFGRRNRLKLVAAAVLATASLVVIGSIGWAVRDREARQADAAKQEAARRAQLEAGIARSLEEAARSYQRDQLPEAMGSVTYAEKLLGGGDVREELTGEVRGWRTDLEMAARLVEISFELAPDGKDLRNADRLYREEFRQYGLDVDALDPAEVAKRVAQSRIAPHLVAALDNWLLARQSPGQMPTLTAVDQNLLNIARRADPDPVRDRIRAALQQRDDKPLREFGRFETYSVLPPATLLLLETILNHTRNTFLGGMQHEEMLREAQRLHPDNFMITARLAFRLSEVTTTSKFHSLMDGNAEEAAGYFRAALAMRPNSVWVRIKLGMALTYQPRHKLVEAESEYREAIRLQPDNAWAHFHLGVNLRRQRKWADAEAELKTAFALKNALDFHELSVLGDVLASQGKTAEAESVFRIVRQEARRRPSFGTYFAHTGNVFLGLWPDEAERYFRADVGINPNDAEARNRLDAAIQRRHAANDWSLTRFLKGESKFYATHTRDHYVWEHGLAQQCVEKQWYAAAARMYKELLTVRPDLTAFLFPAACVATRAGTGQGQDDPPIDEQKSAEWRQQALAWLRADLDLRRNSPGPSRVHSRIWLEIWKSQPDLAGLRDATAIAKLSEGERQACESLWSEVDSRLRQFENVKVDHTFGNVLSPIGSSPDDPDAHVLIGNNLYRLTKYDEAMAAFKEAIRLKPDHADAHKGLGHALISKGKPVEAEASYREAIRLKPENAEGHSGLGLALQKQDKLIEALASCREAIRIKPDFAGAYEVLGAVLSKQGKPVEAEAAFRVALKYRPDLYNARNNLAKELSTQSKFKEAETEYQVMIKRWPVFADPHNDLAWFLVTCPDPKIRDADQAVKLAKKAVELAPKSGNYWNTLGVAYYRTGDWKESITALQKYRELRTDDAEWTNPFFLAMSHWQLGDKVEARKWFDKGVEWMERKNVKSGMTLRVRVEAAALMGIGKKEEQ